MYGCRYNFMQDKEVSRHVSLHVRCRYIVCMQEFAGDLKIVKVEADPCPNLVEKYKVRQPFACSDVK